MKKIILIYAVIVALSGCSVNKDWVATGGSRADATVKLSYQYGYGQDVHVSEQQATELAKKRCGVWGYTGAEAFGGMTTQCNQMGSWGCVDGTATKEYQCTGQGNAVVPNNAQPTSYYQPAPAQQTQPVPVAQPVYQPVAENTAPTYQQPQSGQSGKDLRECLALVDNAAIARCVQGK
ncbi:MAG: YecR family lipoprotein [Methylococcales bacterium]|nr:YecR family lipoprotein [Methylococcales bacterium]